ncbi:MAG: hypothetical protein LBQ02_04755 [Candidatus Nomurabacteria bacterium]|jgi:hypothetical protein|nr:hypothetical protein [Candidatus Nomurabacteria bacterium]
MSSVRTVLRGIGQKVSLIFWLIPERAPVSKSNLAQLEETLRHRKTLVVVPPDEEAFVEKLSKSLPSANFAVAQSRHLTADGLLSSAENDIRSFFDFSSPDALMVVAQETMFLNLAKRAGWKDPATLVSANILVLYPSGRQRRF